MINGTPWTYNLLQIDSFQTLVFYPLADTLFAASASSLSVWNRYRSLAPKCRQVSYILDASALQRNFLAIQLADTLQRTGVSQKSVKPICAECCTSEAEAYCEQCKADFCLVCKGVSHVTKVLKTHRMVPVESKKAEPLCNHPCEKVRYWCDDCHALVCCDCLLLPTHKAHGFSDLPTAASVVMTMAVKSCVLIECGDDMTWNSSWTTWGPMAKTTVFTVHCNTHASHACQLAVCKCSKFPLSRLAVDMMITVVWLLTSKELPVFCMIN